MTVQEVGPGCAAWLRLPGSWGETNIGIVSGDGASLLVDTPWGPRLTRQMLEAFADRPPITTVLNTHADPDHWWGNQELPQAEIVASDDCLGQMRAEAGPAELARLRKVSRAAAKLPGRVGRGPRYVAAFLDPFDLEDVELRYPDRTFSGRREETIGGRDVVFIDHGAAHTASDSVVFVPDARVVFCGDLLFAHVTPVMWHGPVSAWLAALETLMAMDAETFVAGHGSVSTRAELEALHGYWSLLDRSVKDDRAAGRGALEASKRIAALPDFQPYHDWVAPERLYINVATIDRQLAGKGPIPATPPARAKAFDGVACMRHHLR